MRLRYRLEKKPSHEVDVKGTAVALAFLVGVGLFAGGQNNHGMAEPQPSHSTSILTQSTPTVENSETLQPFHDQPDHTERSPIVETSR